MLISASENVCTLLSLSQDGFASLHVACQKGYAQVTELLLHAGANVEQKTKVNMQLSTDFLIEALTVTFIMCVGDGSIFLVP